MTYRVCRRTRSRTQRPRAFKASHFILQAESSFSEKAIFSRWIEQLSRQPPMSSFFMERVNFDPYNRNSSVNTRFITKMWRILAWTEHQTITKRAENLLNIIFSADIKYPHENTINFVEFYIFMTPNYIFNF